MIAKLPKQLLGGLALLSLSAQPLLAQDSEVSEIDQASGEIIVDGYTEKEVRHFLWRSVIESGRVIAKRVGPICVGIDNAPAVLAEPVRARIETNLAELGIVVAEEGCRPNSVVVFHRDAHAFVNWLDENHREAFQALYLPEKRRLIRPVRPVYSWMFIGPEAARLSDGGMRLNRQPANPALAGFQGVGFEPSGIWSTWSGPLAISHSFTVIDIDALEGISTDQLGDYLTMQMLVEFRPGSQPEIPGDSILNLFTDTGGNPDATLQMSKLDRAVLSEFYARRMNFRNSAVRSAIARKAIETLDEDGYILAGK